MDGLCRQHSDEAHLKHRRHMEAADVLHTGLMPANARVRISWSSPRLRRALDLITSTSLASSSSAPVITDRPPGWGAFATEPGVLLRGIILVRGEWPPSRVGCGDRA